jgi:hypothetical protein
MNVSMTRDRYMARGRSHVEVTKLLGRAINVDRAWLILKTASDVGRVGLEPRTNGFDPRFLEGPEKTR